MSYRCLYGPAVDQILAVDKAGSAGDTLWALGDHQGTGRFTRLDTFPGDLNDPQSLHKYLYCHGNPITGIDPTGEFFAFLSAFRTQMQLETQRAMAALSALRNVRAVQTLVNIYQTTVGAYAQLGFRAADFLVRYGPTIQRVTTVSGLVWMASTVQLICEEMGFVSRTGYTEFVAAASGTLFSAGLTLSEMSKQLRGIIEPLRGSRGRLLGGSAANTSTIARNPTYANSPPYRTYSLAAEGRIAPSVRLVRVYNPSVNKMESSWCMRGEDIVGLSRQQIAKEYALDYVPTMICDVHAEGISARSGIVGPNFGHFAGQKTQIELLERGASFRNARPL